jgi:excisionase family DNA binding protein
MAAPRLVGDACEQDATVAKRVRVERHRRETSHTGAVDVAWLRTQLGKTADSVPTLRRRGNPEPSPYGGRLIERHYSTRQLAELLSVNPETIRREAQRGRLRSVRIGSERRYPESAVRQYLENRAEPEAAIAA